MTPDGMFEIIYFYSATRPLHIYVSGSTSDDVNTDQWSHARVPLCIL